MERNIRKFITKIRNLW